MTIKQALRKVFWKIFPQTPPYNTNVINLTILDTQFLQQLDIKNSNYQ